MVQEIKPIEILPFTENERKQLINSADGVEVEYDFRFNLSQLPADKWAEIFYHLWEQEYGGGITPALRGKAIEVTTTPNNLQNVLNALKSAMIKSNERFKLVIEQKNREEEEARKVKEKAKRVAQKAMSDALDKLKF